MRFSVLTPSFNQGQFIENNIRSVMNQDWDDVEHIVIDGGSTDNTLNVLRNYPHLKWVSEADEGQADALNKGLKIATGEIIGWINSDDYYEANIFREVITIFENEPVRWVVGNIFMAYPSFGITKKITSPEITYKKLLKNPDIVKQQATFFKKNALIEIGGWNKKYHMAMDFDLWVRLSKKAPPKMVNREWAYFTHHDLQKTTPKNFLLQLSDIVDILKRENQSWIKIWKTVLKKYYYVSKSIIKNTLIQLSLLDSKYYNAPISLSFGLSQKAVKAQRVVISEEMQQKLLCPSTKAKLHKNGDYFESVIDPKIRYPIIDGIPILINNGNSLFAIDDFIKKINTTFVLDENEILKALKKVIPNIGVNIKAEKNYNEIVKILPHNSKILVIGGSIKGKGMDSLYSNRSFEVIGTDVSFGPYTKIISDAHDITFEDEIFDCVIVQAVLEHVLEPQRCVNEIYRVLKPYGIIYAETPFMQQVHMKQYDFTRFTHLGHRRLFKNFEEIKSGPCCGPGMALAESYTYFLRSFATSWMISRLLTKFAHMTSFFFKYFDYYLIDKPGSYDAASGYFFLGKKTNTILSDRELIKQFKGIK